MKRLLILGCLFNFIGNSFYVYAQSKEVTTQQQTWLSINSTVKLHKNWGFISDAHIRRTDFFAQSNFYFLRGAINYWASPDLTVALGYAHMWIAPTNSSTFLNENRIYQQVQLVSRTNHVSIVQRLRSEQRWSEKIVQNKKSDTLNFTERIRYLLSVTIPIFKNKQLPSLVISDEICLQFGKKIVYNTFDQNRLFIGIKQILSKALSFDAGYMYLYQQKESGYQYNGNKTYRLFLYYTPDLSKHN
jgi:hypothetical protein